MKHRQLFNPLLIAFVSVALLPLVVHAQVVQGCGSLENSYGPFDYRDPAIRRDKLLAVEKNHLTPPIESLSAGRGVVLGGTVLAHLDYTLRTSPNHHRALNSLAMYALNGWPFIMQLSGIPSFDCYFHRALAFQHDDEIVRMIYANYLFRRGDTAGARSKYEEALRLAPESVEVNYNAGLFFARAGELERAKKLAKVAYEGGYPLPGLNKIIADAEQKSVSKK